MFVPKIGITGHRPSGFSNKEHVLEIVPRVVEYCSKMHHNAEFNLGGCIGADMWVAQECVNQKIPFHLYLPFPADVQSRKWTADDANRLNEHVLAAKSVSIVGKYYLVQNYHIRDRLIVDNSHFVVCFWEGRRSGGTYNTIKYAVEVGKQVLNAMNDLQEVSF